MVGFGSAPNVTSSGERESFDPGFSYALERGVRKRRSKFYPG
ncbi:MAG: hypothetical protein RI885_1532 [Actinomycetota bacterium]|jgi:hypothetical protein